MEIVITFVIIWPFAGAVLTWLLGASCGSKSDKIRNFSAFLTVTLQLLSVSVLCLYSFREGQAFHTTMLEGLKVAQTVVSLAGFSGYGLSFAVDSFRVTYTLIAAFMWFVSTMFSFEYMKHYQKNNRHYFFLFVTLGATTGVFLSADFFTMFLFFEIMSLASYVWVVQDERQESLRAGETYLAISIMGGLCILLGMFLLYGISDGNYYKNTAGILMLIGFGAKAGVVFLHIWLPKAHPVAPAPASALLSGILTKTGVFGTMLVWLQMFYGDWKFGLLIYVTGILTMVLGAVLALFSIDLKRTLACSSVSQIGFIFTGLGIAGMLLEDEGQNLAFQGAVLHMINHSLIKLLLFNIVGVVFMNLGKLNFNEIMGYGRKKPLLHILFLIGALGLSGVPFLNGYVSKSLIHEGMILWQHTNPAVWMKITEWLFILSGGLTTAYMTKLYIVLFWNKNKDAARQHAFNSKIRYMGKLTTVLLSITALLFPILGIIIGIYMHTYNMESLIGALTSLAIGFLIYLFIVRKWMIEKGEYVYRWNPRWDLEDRVYRPLLLIMEIIISTIGRFLDKLPDYLVLGLRKTIFKDSPIPHELEEGDAFTHVVGTLMDDSKEVLNHTLRKDHPVKVSYEHKLALWKEEIKENNTMIGRSLSFGLLLFCIGLLVTVIYMLLT